MESEMELNLATKEKQEVHPPDNIGVYKHAGKVRKLYFQKWTLQMEQGSFGDV